MPKPPDWSSPLLLPLLLAFVACGEVPPEREVAATGSMSTRPNILVYVVDTLRADSLGAYGNETVETPHIDALAQEGIVFENAHANSSWTRPTVAAVLTGLRQEGHGAARRRDRLRSNVETLAVLLSREGYATAFVTTNPNAGSFFGFERGFDDMLELYERREAGRVRTRELITTSDEVTRRAAAWLEKAGRPFLLVVHTIDPHTPYAPPKAFDRYGGDYHGRVDGTRRWINDDELGEADRERIRSLYYGEVAFNDHSFGALIDALRSLEQLDDTIVVFTADHGEELWEHGVRGHGKSLRDVSIHVPLVVRLPAGREAGSRVDRPVELVDVLPTLLELLELPAPARLDGRSLFQPATDPPRIQLSSLTLGSVELSAARAYPFKLVRNLATGEEQLFDLSRDEVETAEADPVVRTRLRTALDALDVERHRAEQTETAPTVLPSDVEAALRELGYIDDEGTGAEQGAPVVEGAP